LHLASQWIPAFSGGDTLDASHPSDEKAKPHEEQAVKKP
jgi:hypothetical protein